MAKLIVISSSGARQEYDLSGSLTIGRNPENTIQINEEKASRTHCRVHIEKGRALLDDLDSSNGTKLNGRKISSSVLAHGDAILIGATQITFHDPELLDRTVVLRSVDDKLPARKAERERDELKPSTSAAEEPAFGGVMSAVAVPPPEPSSKKRMQPAAAAPPRRKAASNSPMSGAAIALVAIVGLAAAVYLARQRAGHPQPVASADVPVQTQTPVPPNPAPTEPVRVETPQSEKPPAEPAPADPVQPAKVDDEHPAPKPALDPAALKKELDDALAARDKALAAGNLLRARAAVSAFLTAHPDGETAARARDELKDTQRLIEASQDETLSKARAAAAEKKYRLASQRCTGLLSSDPSGKYGAQAREILTKIDTETETRFNALFAQSDDAIKCGKLDKAMETLSKSLDELGGTRWAAQLSARQLQVIMARGFLKQLETERLKRTSGSKYVKVKLPSKKNEGILTGIDSANIEVRAGALLYKLPLKEIGPADFQAVAETLGFSGRHIESAYLWLINDRKDAAQSEIEAALNIPEEAAAAAALAAQLGTIRNLHVYDFSKWQQQIDWEALSGSWSTQNERYVLESADGGDTMLRTEALGGPFPANGAHISFDFEPLNPGKDFLFSFEFGTERQIVSAAFSSAGLVIGNNLPGAENEKAEWKVAPTHVDIRIKGKKMNVSVNGAPPRSLEVNGLSALQGTVTFRARETACAIDNVILRTQ